MSPRDAREHKPRTYSGAVDWMDLAAAHAEGWAPQLLADVRATNPYLTLNPTGVRPQDWVELVAHVSSSKREDPLVTANRLATYVTAYRERYAATLGTTQVKESQTP